MKRYLFLAMTLLLQSSVFGGGPVYVNKAESAPVSETADALITQTVYGFLDFTTTIANTVMVFSPQSQPAADIIPTKVETVVSSVTAPPILSSRVEVREGLPVKAVREGKSGSEDGEEKPQPKETNKVEKPIPKNPPVVEKTQSKPPPPPQEKTVPKPTPQEKIPPSKNSQTSPKPTPVIQVKHSVKTSQPHDKPASLEKPSPKPAQPSTEKPKPKLKPTLSSKVQPKPLTNQEPAFVFENNLEQAEYDFLSRQPSEVVDETYKVVDVGATTKGRFSPTGLVTKLGGTIVKEGLTTVHETSVIGTYISGKYAQVLKSKSEIEGLGGESLEEGGLPLEALFSQAPHVRNSRRPALGPPPPFKNRLHRTRPPPQEIIPEPTKRVPFSGGPANTRPAFKLSHNRFNRVSSSLEPVSTVEVGTASTRRYQRARSSGVGGSSSSNAIETGGQSRRFKPKPSQASNYNQASSTSLYKFKLSRPQGRWHYKTSPKPRVAIRRQDEDGPPPPSPTPALPSYPETIEESEQSTADSEISSTTSPAATPTPSLPLQTIRVDISTPADFSDVYYEIAVIKSPYTFQVGTVKNTRYVTVTSTYEKLLVDPAEASSTSTEPLTENILTTKQAFDKEASIATLPPIAIAGEETLPLETMTEFLSTSEVLLKTHLLPVVRESNTTTLTLVQTYEVTKLVTATKTLPPTELFQFIPSKTLNEFNSKLDEAGSELHLELEFGDNGNDDEQPSSRTLPEYQNVTTEDPTSLSTLVTSPPFAQEQLSPEKLQQLALLRLLNPNQPPVVTSTPILSIQTLYETHVIPLFNGQNTLFTTISRSVGTVTNTQYKTSTIPLPSIPLPIFPTQQFQPQLTSTPIVTQTVVTETNSKVLKLTFGAKTAYTTLFSTKVVPTLLTTFITAQLPVQATAAPFPSFFPPFNPFNFVG